MAKSLPDILNKDSNKRDDKSLLGVGFASTVFGVAGLTFMTSPLIPLAFTGIGMATTIYGAVDKMGFFKDKDREFWEELLSNTGLVTKNEKLPLLQEVRETDFGTLYRFNCPIGLGESDFHKKKDQIRCALGKDIKIKYSNKNILIEVYHKQLQDMYPFTVVSTKKLYEICFGYTFGEKPVSIELFSDSEPHMLIAGSSGGGKSTIIRAILTLVHLIKDSERLINIRGFDLKGGVELQLFESSKLMKSLCTTVQESNEELSNILEMIDDRYDTFKKNGVKDIEAYNKKFPSKRMKREFVVIDEFADFYFEGEDQSLTKAERNIAKGCTRKIEEISAKARACGVHLLVACQRSDADIITGKIKNNINLVIGVKCKDAVNSKVVGIDGLEKLKGKGHCVIQSKGKEVEAQAMFLKVEDAEKILKPYMSDEKDKENGKPKSNYKPRNKDGNKSNNSKDKNYTSDPIEFYRKKTGRDNGDKQGQKIKQQETTPTKSKEEEIEMVAIPKTQPIEIEIEKPKQVQNAEIKPEILDKTEIKDINKKKNYKINRDVLEKFSEELEKIIKNNESKKKETQEVSKKTENKQIYNKNKQHVVKSTQCITLENVANQDKEKEVNIKDDNNATANKTTSTKVVTDTRVDSAKNEDDKAKDIEKNDIVVKEVKIEKKSPVKEESADVTNTTDKDNEDDDLFDCFDKLDNIDK